jgi:ABC-type branched-subunit amino acid transport system ATPase component
MGAAIMNDVPILRLETISKAFQGVRVIQNLDFTVRRGERRGLIGPNGAGKTTLINIITGKYRADAGMVIYDGKSIAKLSPYQINRLGIARSFQILSLFRDMTVRENLRNAALRYYGHHVRIFEKLAVSSETEKAVIEVSDLIGLHDALDVPVQHLTYGMQRRLDIGLVLVQEPNLIILDEPAAGLTAAETRELVSMLKSVLKERTLILVEHDMDVVYALCDIITVIDYGKLVTEGAPAEINVHPEVRRLYLGEEMH